MARDFFGHILVLMKKFSLVIMGKKEMLDSLISVRVESTHQAVREYTANLEGIHSFKA